MGAAEVARLIELGELRDDEAADILAEADRLVALYPRGWQPVDPMRTSEIACANLVREHRGMVTLDCGNFAGHARPRPTDPFRGGEGVGFRPSNA
jgi:hypothetical protein